MKLTKIEIKGLFDLFDYDIPLTNEENLLIITGPNGFGKTMILNIIYSFFNNKLDFFHKLVFKTITIWTDEHKRFLIEKDNDKNEINSSIFANGIFITAYKHPLRKSNVIFYGGNYSYSNITIDNVFEIKQHEEKDNIVTEETNTSFYERLFSLSNQLKIHLIREQRLLRRTPKKKKQENSSEFLMQSETEIFVIDTIEEYANELRDLINSNLDESYTITQQIDSTFPKRLLSEKGTLSIEEFDARFKLLKEKQEKLKRFGLSESEQEIPDYDEKNASVLLVYLKDSEDKIKVFDGLLSKLELFTNILNERRFTHKFIKIDRKKGFIFITKNGVELSLTDLSSGEQHEVVLLYELIFKTNPNTLVLIDEPEISLHVTWQKEFLSDLLKILELQKMQVIVATHSPQIINDRWDLVFNLETKKMQ